SDRQLLPPDYVVSVTRPPHVPRTSQQPYSVHPALPPVSFRTQPQHRDHDPFGILFTALTSPASSSSSSSSSSISSPPSPPMRFNHAVSVAAAASAIVAPRLAAAFDLPTHLSAFYDLTKNGGCKSFYKGRSDFGDGQGNIGYGFCDDTPGAIYI